MKSDRSAEKLKTFVNSPLFGITLSKAINFIGLFSYVFVLWITVAAITNCIKLSSKLQIRDYVWFTGWIPDKDMIRYLSTADICVDPDPSNPLNDKSTWIKIMEYMALGKPIVSFDLPETRFSAREAAIYAKPNDEQDFARKIAKLMDNLELRKRMGAYGRKRIERELAWHHVSKNLLTAYKSLKRTM